MTCRLNRRPSILNSALHYVSFARFQVNFERGDMRHVIISLALGCALGTLAACPPNNVCGDGVCDNGEEGVCSDCRDPPPDSPDAGPKCDLACVDGAECAEYEGIESCCDVDFPNACPGIHGCFSDEATRDRICPTISYGDPHYGCQGSELSLPLNGLSVCAPKCASGICPAAFDGLAGACIQGDVGEDSFCVLVCTDFGTTGGQCPDGMTCSGVTDTAGICLW